MSSYLIFPLNLSHTQFTDFHVDYSHGGGCMDYITIFPPVDGQTEFCGNLIILSPGINLIFTALTELAVPIEKIQADFMLTLILMVKMVKMAKAKANCTHFHPRNQVISAKSQP